MVKATQILLVCFVLSLTGYLLTFSELWETVAISLGITFYHFSMRLAVGSLLDQKLRNEVDYHCAWFQERSFEPKLYAFAHVRIWKKHMPTFEADLFDLRTKNLESIVKATCQAEIVHEIIIVLSHLPIILGFAIGTWKVLIATSVLAALIDLLFVMIQRYNRPRLVLLMERWNVRQK